MTPAGILIVAHAPLASALRACALHVWPDCADAVAAVDVQPNVSADESQQSLRIALDQLKHSRVLVLTDMPGATPANVAARVVDGQSAKLLSGVNFPMLLRAVSGRHEAFDTLIGRCIDGGKAGIMTLHQTAPQNQSRTSPSAHDQHHHHQQ